jgi:hypothetical protein
VTLQGAAAWQHAWGDVTPVSTLAFAGGDAFQVTGAPIAEDALLLKAGFDVDVTAGAKLGLFYAGQLASDAADNSIQGRFSVAFCHEGVRNAKRRRRQLRRLFSCSPLPSRKNHDLPLRQQAICCSFFSKSLGWPT